MTDIRFYHLETKPLEQALPALLQKIFSKGHRVLLSTPTLGRAQQIDSHLWVYAPETFLPHGLVGEAMDHRQPILISTDTQNTNKADVLVLCDYQTVPENIQDFSMCCDFLNGHDEGAITAARTRWAAYKSMGHTVTYWQQTESEGWREKS